MKSYEQYEKECKRIRQENEHLLNEFGIWLFEKKISKNTVNKHLSNIDLYINDFLIYEDTIEAADGADHVGMFLGYWFIRKAMWASRATIRENAASLKKFYQFLFEKKMVPKESVEFLQTTIKEDMPDWLATLERYDNPDIEDPDEVWGILK